MEDGTDAVVVWHLHGIACRSQAATTGTLQKATHGQHGQAQEERAAAYTFSDTVCPLLRISSSCAFLNSRACKGAWEQAPTLCHLQPSGGVRVAPLLPAPH